MKSSNAKILWYKRHYQQNKKLYHEKAKRAKQKTLILILKYKAEHGCARYPENHPSCLDFHHEDQTTKEIDIYLTIKRGWSFNRILGEISKCIVLCSNCHRKEHWRLENLDDKYQYPLDNPNLTTDPDVDGLRPPKVLIT